MVNSFNKGSAIALGNFDGVHLGHQEIIKICLLAAKQLDLRPIVLSFRPHPAKFLAPNNQINLLTNYDDKLDYIKSLGVKEIIELDFTNEFSKITDADFIKRLLIKKFNVKYLVTGNNFFYGHNREGDSNKLSKEAIKNHFQYVAVNQIYYAHQPISSSLIRKFINMGLVRTANKMLGRPYRVSGFINRGKGIAARQLGFATANMKWVDDLIKPCPGVYLSRVKVDKIIYFGVTNIGYKPTVVDNGEFMAETHIMNFDYDLYDRYISLELLSFLRPERKFSSFNHLQSQIKQDINLAKYNASLYEASNLSIL